MLVDSRTNQRITFCGLLQTHGDRESQLSLFGIAIWSFASSPNRPIKYKTKNNARNCKGHRTTKRTDIRIVSGIVALAVEFVELKRRRVKQHMRLRRLHEENLKSTNKSNARFLCCPKRTAKFTLCKHWKSKHKRVRNQHRGKQQKQKCQYLTAATQQKFVLWLWHTTLWAVAGAQEVCGVVTWYWFDDQRDNVSSVKQKWNTCSSTFDQPSSEIFDRSSTSTLSRIFSSACTNDVVDDVYRLCGQLGTNCICCREEICSSTYQNRDELIKFLLNIQNTTN